MLVFEKINQQESYSGPSRVGFSFSYSTQLHCSILFGGCKDTDVYLYDHSKRQWSSKSTSASKKQPRLSKFHAAAVIQHIPGLVVSGGQDESGHSLQDIYLLTFKDWKWRKLLLHKSPVPRERHSLIPLSQSEMILFGGVSMPYNDFTNDCWTLSLKIDSKSEQKYDSSFQCCHLPTKGPAPEGACYAESTVIVGDRLFCGSIKKTKNQPIQLFSLDLRSRIWRKLQLKLMVSQIRFYKIVSMQRDENLILSTLGGPNRQNSNFYMFNQNTLALSPLEVSSPFEKTDVLVIDPTSLTQTALICKAKRIFTVHYHLDEPSNFEPGPSSNSIEDYLIAIKHEQILSQQLNKKNGLLQELYKQMQNYITVLNREYQNYQCDLSVENEKARHIEDCQFLKSEYTRLNQAYEESVGGIRALRGELSAINQDFQRCIETEFDQQA